VENAVNAGAGRSGFSGLLSWLRRSAEHPLEGRVRLELDGLIVRLRLRLALWVGGRHVRSVAEPIAPTVGMTHSGALAVKKKLMNDRDDPNLAANLAEAVYGVMESRRVSG
jgi:hypothetical protein